MIHYSSPQDTDKNIGKAYNEIMDLLKPEDWCILTDADTCFLTTEYGRIIERAIKEYPDTGMFVAYTNRLGNQDQLLNIADYNLDIGYHIRIAKEQEELPFSVRPLIGLAGGMLMGIKKDVFLKVGKFKDGFHIDNDWSFRCLYKGYRIMLIENIYLLHLRELKDL